MDEKFLWYCAKDSKPEPEDYDGHEELGFLSRELDEMRFITMHMILCFFKCIYLYTYIVLECQLA